MIKVNKERKKYVRRLWSSKINGWMIRSGNESKKKERQNKLLLNNKPLLAIFPASILCQYKCTAATNRVARCEYYWHTNAAKKSFLKITKHKWWTAVIFHYAWASRPPSPASRFLRAISPPTARRHTSLTSSVTVSKWLVASYDRVIKTLSCWPEAAGA